MLKVTTTKECMNFLYWFFNYRFKFRDSVFNVCRNLTMLCFNVNDVIVITVQNVDYCFIIHNISKSEAINLFKKSVLEDHGFL